MKNNFSEIQLCGKRGSTGKRDKHVHVFKGKKINLVKFNFVEVNREKG